LLNKKNYIRETLDIDSDEYNDLILVEKAIKELRERGFLSDKDLEVISEMAGDIGRFDERPVNQRKALYKKFTAICDRVAFYMGDYFTDDGYLDYMKTKYKLNDEQVDILLNYIKSRFRHKLAKKVPKNHYLPTTKDKETINDQDQYYQL